MEYREFDYGCDSVGSLFELYAATYGDCSAYRNRWEWEYQENPRKDGLKIFIAVDDGRVVGSTTRLPAPLKIRSEKVAGAFNCNSMVHPDYRGKGIIKELYKASAKAYPVLLSKGTAAGMYKLLKRMDYKDLRPNTFMVCITRPLSWLLWRSGIYKVATAANDDCDKLLERLKVVEVKRFTDRFREFFLRASSHLECCLVKDQSYMNWRYIENPINKYVVLSRGESENVESVAILRIRGREARLVDLMWDQTVLGQPAQIINIVKQYARKIGCIKLVCWTSDKVLRKEMARCGFWDNGETPNFSAYMDCKMIEDIRDLRLSFFEGDGDSEYLK